LETLDQRALPAVLNLTTPGSQVVADQFIVRQSAGGSRNDFTTFVRLADCKTEEGYNTTARHTQFDEVRGPGVQSALKLSDIPVVTVDGVAYREFVLDVHELKRSPLLSLDQVRIYMDGTSNFSGYNKQTAKLNGDRPVFDLDAGGDVSVKLNGNLNRGHGFGDMRLLVRDSAFAGATPDTFVSLYSKFGGLQGARADGGLESWSIRKTVVAPPPAEGSTLSGRVFVDAFGDNVYNPNGTTMGGDAPIAGVKISLFVLNASGTYDFVTETTTDADGAFSFGGLAAGTYQIVESQPATLPTTGQDLDDGADYLGSLGGTIGDGEFGDSFTITVGANQQGTNYHFTEVVRN